MSGVPRPTDNNRYPRVPYSCCSGVGVAKSTPSDPLISQFLIIIKMLPIEYHVHIWQASPYLMCYECNSEDLKMLAKFEICLGGQYRHGAISQMAKALESMSISYRSDAKVSDRYLIGVDPRVFAICMGLATISASWQDNVMARKRFPLYWSFARGIHQ